jgi:hypothetical protein
VLAFDLLVMFWLYFVITYRMASSMFLTMKIWMQIVIFFQFFTFLVSTIAIGMAICNPKMLLDGKTTKGFYSVFKFFSDFHLYLFVSVMFLDDLY